MPPKVTIHKLYRFEAAHRLPKVAPGHKCARLHGHSYRVEVHVRGHLIDGMVMDFAALDAVAKPLIERLDHRTLNEIEGLSNPTAEVLAVWLWERLQVPGLRRVTVWETENAGATYRGPK